MVDQRGSNVRSLLPFSKYMKGAAEYFYSPKNCLHMMQCKNNLREMFQYLIDILSGSEFDRSLHNYILLTMWFFLFYYICVR